MKGIIKFMTAAVAVGSLASCTDDLVTSSQQVKEGDLTGYLEITDEVATRVAYAPGEGYVWDDKDAIKVYTVDQLLYNNYNLISGGGTTQGEFELDGSDKISGSSSKKYAVTEPKDSKTIYGISATDNGTALLTATVKPRYDWSDVITMADGTDKEAYKLPTPFWGEAQVNGTKINVAFKALTAFIKLDLRRVPIGTQAIVVTSHEDYYTVAPKGEAGAVLHAGGGNEPLAGTMNAELVTGAALAADTRLVSYDTLRVDFDKVEEIAGQDKIIYLAVPAQHYDKLDVLAVTTDNRAPYTWTEAQVLASYNDEVFEVGKTKAIYQDAEYEIPATVTDPEEISTIIAQRYDGNHDVRVKVMGVVDPGTLYILNNGQAQGLEYTNVEITFAQQLVNDLDIVECPANIVVGGAGSMVAWMPSDLSKATRETQSKTAKQTVKLNFEDGADAGKDINLYLPESDVILTTAASGSIFRSAIDIIAANTNNISGYDKAPYNQKKAGVIVKGGQTYSAINVLAPSRKTAVYAYEDDTEITNLRLGSQQPGNVRLTDALAGTITFTASDIVGTPAIWTSGAAAIKKIAGDQNKVKVHAYWTGKSLTDKAIRKGYEGANVEDDEVASGAIYTAAQLQGMGLDKGLELGGSAFNSGAGVTEYTISKKVGFIWLGGQEFPWIGPQMGIMKGDKLVDGVNVSDRQLRDADFMAYDPFDNAEYALDVVVDGNDVELRNMEMTINDPYFIDPHRCCTSCGEFVVKVERDLGLIRSINTTQNAEVKNIRLNDVELVCTDTKVNIPNVGSIVGRITADGGVTMDDNRATNLQIAICGGNAGGHVGAIQSETGKVIITNALSGLYGYDLANTTLDADNGFMNMVNYAETDVFTNFVATIGDNAGGLVGQIVAPDDVVQIAGVEIGMFAVAAQNSNNVGGIVGNLAYGKGALTTSTVGATNKDQWTAVVGDEVDDNVSILRGNVVVDNIFATESSKKATTASLWGSTGNNVGGFAGKARAAEADAAGKNFAVVDATTSLQLVADGTVKATNLLAQGRYAGGLIGYNKQAEAAANDHVAATFISATTNKQRNTEVTIANLEATNSCAGGLVGQQVMGDLVISGGALDKDHPSHVTVEIGKLSTAFAGGGLVGQNLDDVDIDGKWRAGDAATPVTANVTAWANTWDAVNFTGGFAGEAPATLRMFCGSFDNLAGLVSEHFKVKNNASIVTKGLIPDATKKALLFQLHTDATNTKGVKTDPYWGDQLGYVGYADATSFYLLNGSDYRQGDQQFNYRKPY